MPQQLSPQKMSQLLQVLFHPGMGTQSGPYPMPAPPRSMRPAPRRIPGEEPVEVGGGQVVMPTGRLPERQMPPEYGRYDPYRQDIYPRPAEPDTTQGTYDPGTAPIQPSSGGMDWRGMADLAFNPLNTTALANVGMAALPFGMAVRGAKAVAPAIGRALGGAAEAAIPATERAVNYGGLKFTPEQWAAHVRSQTPGNLALGERGFLNVPEGASAATGASEYSAYRSSPRSMADELRNIHRQALARGSQREIAPYSAAERARVQTAAMRQRQLDEIRQQLLRKGQLDAATRRLLAGQ